MNIFRIVSRLNHLIMWLKFEGHLTKRSIWLNNHARRNLINCDESNDSGSSTFEEHEHDDKTHKCSTFGRAKTYEFHNKVVGGVGKTLKRKVTLSVFNQNFKDRISNNINASKDI